MSRTTETQGHSGVELDRAVATAVAGVIRDLETQEAELVASLARGVAGPARFARKVLGGRARQLETVRRNLDARRKIAARR